MPTDLKQNHSRILADLETYNPYPMGKKAYAQQRYFEYHQGTVSGHRHDVNEHALSVKTALELFHSLGPFINSPAIVVEPSVPVMGGIVLTYLGCVPNMRVASLVTSDEQAEAARREVAEQGYDPDRDLLLIRIVESSPSDSELIVVRKL